MTQQTGEVYVSLSNGEVGGLSGIAYRVDRSGNFTRLLPFSSCSASLGQARWTTSRTCRKQEVDTL